MQPLPQSRRSGSREVGHPRSGAWWSTNSVILGADRLRHHADGASTGPDGLTGSINTAADREVVVLLRAHADVVIVGAGALDLDPWMAAGLVDDMCLTLAPTMIGGDLGRTVTGELISGPSPPPVRPADVRR